MPSYGIRIFGKLTPDMTPVTSDGFTESSFPFREADATNNDSVEVPSEQEHSRRPRRGRRARKGKAKQPVESVATGSQYRVEEASAQFEGSLVEPVPQCPPGHLPVPVPANHSRVPYVSQPLPQSEPSYNVNYNGGNIYQYELSAALRTSSDMQSPIPIRPSRPRPRFPSLPPVARPLFHVPQTENGRPRFIPSLRNGFPPPSSAPTVLTSHPQPNAPYSRREYAHAHPFPMHRTAPQSTELPMSNGWRPMESHSDNLRHMQERDVRAQMLNEQSLAYGLSNGDTAGSSGAPFAPPEYGTNYYSYGGALQAPGTLAQDGFAGVERYTGVDVEAAAMGTNAVSHGDAVLGPFGWS